MKKVGILTLVLVFILGSLGVGYATWSDTLYINGHVETGEVLAGFTDCWTDDDSDMGTDPKLPDIDIDPVAPPTGPVCGELCPPNIEGKDVAETTCEPVGPPKIHSDGVTPTDPPQYEKIHIEMTNVYPSYNPTVSFDVMNCGSIPVVITGAEIVSICDTPITPIPLVKCTLVEIDLDGDGVLDTTIGFYMDPDEPDQQIEQGESIQYYLLFHFKEALLECQDCLCFEIEMDAVQWNKAD